MKAILVIDMPQTCKECKLKYLDTGDDAYWGVNVERCICDNCEIEHNERAYDCQLKPMPQKKVVTVKRIEDIQSYSITEVADKISAKIILKTNEVFALGWNACIDAIIGDTDGTKGEITGETE